MIGLATAAAQLSSAAGQLLAAGTDPGGHGDDFGKSSPVGLLLLILFLIAVAFLVRSMTKHLKKVPASFGPEADGRSAKVKAREAKAEAAAHSDGTAAKPEPEPTEAGEQPSDD